MGIWSVKGDPIIKSGKGYDQMTVTTTAKSLPNIPKGASAALINIEKKSTAPSDTVRAARFLFDDKSQLASGTGQPLALNDYIQLETREQLLNFWIRRGDDQDVTLNVIYYYG